MSSKQLNSFDYLSVIGYKIIMTPNAKSNHLAELSQLKNTFYGMRHGESIANKQHFIASSFDQHKDVELTDLGRTQVEDSAGSCNGLFPNGIRIFSSDYKRTFDTAGIVANRLNINNDSIGISPLLRDRDFGEFNGKSGDFLNKTWEKDKVNPAHTDNNVESVLTVMERITRFIRQLESEFSNQQFLLVSHGDPLTILEAGFKKIPASDFQTLNIFGNAELRQFELV